jgi:hypothetical protein
MSYIILIFCWFHIIVLNVHTPTEDKTDDVKDIFYMELERIFDKFHKYRMKILLDLNAKVGREDILNRQLGMKVCMTLVMIMINFATHKNLIFKGTMFPHPSIPDGKPHNQIDVILTDRRMHSSIFNVRSFRAADCDTDHYLVVAKIRERPAVNKQRSHKTLYVDKNEVEGKQKYRVMVSNRFGALEDMEAEVEINTVRKTTRKNINISAKESLRYYELKKRQPWFNEGCSKLLDQKKQTKLQWLQDRSEVNGYNLNNVKSDARRNFRKKEGISERQN